MYHSPKKKNRELILSLPAPLPNIILLGDFNIPEVIWDNPHAYNPSSELLIDLATLVFLNQQVSTPIRKSNACFLFRWAHKVCWCRRMFFSDYCLIKIKTYIPVDPITNSKLILILFMTGEDTIVIHQTYYRDEWYALSWAIKKFQTLLSTEKKIKVLHYLCLENYWGLGS